MRNAEVTPELALAPVEGGGVSEARSKFSIAARNAFRKSKRNDRGELDFAAQCRAYRLPPVIGKPAQQFKLLKSQQTPRKDGRNIPKAWHFDFAWPDYRVIVEIDGGVWMPGGGAHSHPVDVTRNMAKRNDAALAGFLVLAFTPQQVKNGEAIADTQRLLAARGWVR